MDYEDQDDLKFLDDVVESLYEELEVAKNTNAALTRILNLAGEATVEIEETLANQTASEDLHGALNNSPNHFVSLSSGLSF